MIRLYRNLLFLSLFIFTSGVVAGVEDRVSQISEKISALITKSIEHYDIPAISIGIVDRKGLAWSGGFGYANRKKNILADEITLYRAGSLAKLLTASAILQLEEKGIVDLGQALSDSLVGFGYRSRFDDPGQITLRQLLTHHSGLPSNINKGQWTDERFTLLVSQLKNEYVSYPTEFILNYSNVGYSLLGAVIEQASGQSFESYMREHILTPLEMSSTEFSSYADDQESIAVGHRQGKQRANLPVRDIPALGLNTNVSDLAKFVSAILSGGKYQKTRLLNKRTVNSMFQPQNSHIALDFDQLIGIPWMLGQIKTSSQDPIAEHSGSMMNYSSHIMLVPGLDIGIVMLSNTGEISDLLQYMSEEIVYKILGERKQTPINYYTPQEPMPAITRLEHKPGTRYLSKEGVIELDTSNAEIRSDSAGKRINLIPLPDGWFGISPDDQSVATRVSEKTINGHQVMVAENNGEARRIGTRLVTDENLFNWDTHFGDYTIVNQDADFPVTDVRLFRQNEIIYLCYRMPQLSEKLIFLPITPVSKNEAITQGLDRARGETILVEIIEDEVHLIYSGFLAKKTSNL